MIQVQDDTGFTFKLWVPRPYPTSVTPGPNGILAQPPPDGRPADGGGDAAINRLAGDFSVRQPRKRQSQIAGQLTSQRFYLHHDFMGEKARGVLVVAARAGRPRAARKSVFAISIRSAVATAAFRQFACSIGHRQPGG